MDHSELTDYPAEDVLVLEDAAMLRALGGELRGRIVDLLRERAASATELAQALDVPKGTAGYHLKVLERAGLVRVVATRRVRAVTEKFYGRVARLFLVNPEGRDESHPKGAIAAGMLRQGANEVPRQGVDPELIKGGLIHTRMRPATARRFIRRLDDLLKDFRAQEDPNGEDVFVIAASIFPTSARLPERDDDD
jgi:DNA-binding transcriptional ArsR family regulator